MTQSSAPASPPPMRQSLPQLPRRKFGETRRKDFWWLQPLAVFLGFAAFIVYSTWAAFQNAHYRFGPYLSPFYAPELWGDPQHAWFGGRPGWIPAWAPFSPAFLVLWAPGGFRLTCYYYRGAYYKAFWADPLSCAVGEPRKSFRGENSFPLILQNIHRYFMYLAVIFLFLLAYDVYLGMWFTTGTGLTQQPTVPGEKLHFGIGVGTLVLLVNLCLLSSYTLGCHSLRHLVGGWRDRISAAPVCQKAYECVGCFNRRHMLFAWCSLFSVGFSDVYVRLCSMGIWHDWHWSIT